MDLAFRNHTWSRRGGTNRHWAYDAGYFVPTRHREWDLYCGGQPSIHRTGPGQRSNQARVSLMYSFRGGMWSVS